MKLIHIVGRKNHGKTALMVDLIEEFARQGVAVGTIKHSRHDHELDTPGKDSYAHRRAGASPAAVVAEKLIGLWLPRHPGIEPYTWLAPMFAGCEIVLVEGDLDGPGIKVEVWRQAVGSPPLASTHRDIELVVSDDPVELDIPVWPRGKMASLAQRLLALARTD